MTVFWDSERDDTLVCVAVRDETHDVKTFVFAAPEPRWFRFSAGQFLTFAFRVDGVEAPRCYTISSPPTRPDRVAITVKRQPGGVVSPWLHATMRPGVSVPVSGPIGDFRADANTSSRLLLISGGSGITPLLSMTRAAHDLANGTDIVFVHAARTPGDALFRAELLDMARAGQNLRPAFICERADGAWDGFLGRLSLPVLASMAPDFLARDVFCCGPAPFMAAVRAMLETGGFDQGRYHEESFDFSTLAVDAGGPPPPAEPAVTAKFTIRFATSERDVVCPAGTTVLEAARAAGMRLASSCAKGVCGTCKSRLVSGRVDMVHGGGIRKREVDSGLFLPCCSRPLSDLVIER